MDENREDGRRRVIIEGVAPEIDGGRFPIKRTVGERVVVEADAFTDGHDAITCRLAWRPESEPGSKVLWREVPMQALVNDRWRASFTVNEAGRWLYTVVAWVDRFKTWRRDFKKRVEAGQDVAIDLRIGAALVREAGERAVALRKTADGRVLDALAQDLEGEGKDPAPRLRLALDEELAQLMDRYPDRLSAATYPRELAVVVDRERARYSTWYEMFPRSAGPDGRHGTFRDCEGLLPYVAGMGFDVLYMPPIHPIGRTFRKGKNNKTEAEPDDVGSPWAIGAAEGGHKDIHPDLGTIEDFRRFQARARELGIELALDIAYQAAPDHPYVEEHPEWFRQRPDGTIQYAENPPKKYQDIYPFDFETDAWRELWEELKSVVDHWIGEGVRIFRVDNPHTKPFPFWEWLITEVKREHPDVIFLAEAFTRPKIMYRLAKLGFTQSYNYFPWRNQRWELVEYFTELNQTAVKEFFRPNLWPNTPDILTEYLQIGGRPAFVQRLLLAATLGASYGIYGPPFELMERVPRERGSEEYLNSEKYQLREWELNSPHSLRELIALVNRIRRENRALQSDHSLRFHRADNEQMICYSKVHDAGGEGENALLMVINLDPNYAQSTWVELDLDTLGLERDQPFQVHDLLTGARYLWHGSRNFVRLDPQQVPGHIFRVRRRVRTERDFDYFL
ncbi:MAG TPA: alpha-1,4-glucan--maltose-1-phosphate maltosyltransferase [Thermoanaerobaculia bacterium]|jgi:starch synthase (maltosyl-transferring)|nr:alpha-1,4-glucan--maltose-1-phosphate maltosyltransferase [Thermoanaerobaculia bacterium]